eukprot:CAMPEP_0172363354 /NCGR_PEP_ID=MMETSP1060-20121228/6742_1 /TAXON_ID=37318 /ORGANISM="Pseudo-nitzschia pungens, Strain cf. cingulata" /LENGTH=211 /DNA_ID=CAMNT_0013086081 /DNA_START=177 /DNA_END=812 /DNA_ORIENTATION=-
MFINYTSTRVRKAVSSGNQDLGVALALYVVYPAILWLLVDKFHGVCGLDTYAAKQEAIAANKSVVFWFTALMRTYKLTSILLFQADASDKEEDPEAERLVDCGGSDDEGCTKQKCRVWFILSQELTAILFVAFLLIVCLPVLAFWFMFIGACVSSCNIFSLFRRLWKDAHSVPIPYEESIMDDSQSGDEIEFQEFLNNFVDDANDLDRSRT